MSSHLKILATEECCYERNYTELKSNQFLSTAYVVLGSKFTSHLLAGKSQLEIPAADKNLEDSLRAFSNQLGIASFGRSTISTKRSILMKLASKLPLPLKMVGFKLYVRLRAIKQPDYYWNVFWK
jgi:hypothetical protein